VFTVANVKITELTALTNPASSDVLPIVDVGADTTKKVTIADLLENAGDGSAANPAFSFDSDKNTGIYRPGADQLAISTGGTGRLFIDSSGRLGVGTSSPQVQLHCTDDIRFGNAVTLSRSLSTGLVTITDATAEPFTQGFAFRTNETAEAYRFQNGDGTTTYMTIRGGGRVGIGTQNPAGALHCDAASGVDGPVFDSGGTGNSNHALLIRDSSNNQLLRVNNDGKTGIDLIPSGNSKLQVNGSMRFAGSGSATDSSNPVIYRVSGEDTLAFANGNSERLRLDSSGNLKLGGTLPLSPNISLNSNGSATFAGSLDLTDTTIDLYSQTTNSASRTFQLFSDIGGTKTEKAAILADGSASFANNVGIGTTSPGNTLHLSGTNGVGMRIENTSNSISAYSTLESSGALQANISGAGVFSWVTGGGEKVRIDNSGRLLVGTTSARSNFFNTTTVTAGIQAEDTGEGSIISAIRNVNDANSVPVFLLAKSRGTAVGSNTIVQANDQLGYLSFQGSDGGQFVEAAQIKGEVDGTPSANDMPGRLVFSTTADGASSPTERLRIDNSGAASFKGGTVLVEATSNTANAQLSLGRPNSTSAGYIRYINNENAMAFRTNGSGEDMRLDSSGRLLVGASSTSGVDATLQVVGDTAAQFHRGINAASGASIAISKSRNTVYGSNTIVQDDDLIGTVAFRADDGTDYHTTAAFIGCHVDGTPGANDMPGRLVFATTADGANSSTERLIISSSGVSNFFGATGVVYAKSATSAGTAERLFIGYHSATSAASGGTIAFNVFTNGNVTNTNNSYGAISDAKLKENIVDASAQWDDIKNLRVRNYNFIGGQTHTQIGVVAQEVETVSPGLVSESPDRDEEGNDLGTTTKSVNYSVLYMKAVKALQEAMERIETLEASNTDLLARVAALEAN